jgi:hypothetical protein
MKSINEIHKSWLLLMFTSVIHAAFFRVDRNFSARNHWLLAKDVFLVLAELVCLGYSLHSIATVAKQFIFKFAMSPFFQFKLCNRTAWQRLLLMFTSLARLPTSPFHRA